MELRAAITQALLGHLREERPELATALERRLGSEALARVDERLGISMLPLEEHLDILDALAAEVPGAELQDIFCSVFRHRLSQMPAIRSFLDATLRVFSATPPNLARVVPGSWRSLTRDAGTFSAPIVVDANTFEHVFDDYDPQLGERANWSYTLAGALDGIIERVGCQGRTEIHGDPRSGRVVFRARWRPVD